LGKFTLDAGERFEGMSVLGEGNVAVIGALDEEGALLLAEDYNHKYPYDWRTKKPTIFRATDQWFASVEGFRDEALEAIETVRFGQAIRSSTTGNAEEDYFHYSEGLSVHICTRADAIENRAF
jgi:isoleucyl-tRNA synthetase